LKINVDYRPVSRYRWISRFIIKRKPDRKGGVGKLQVLVKDS